MKNIKKSLKDENMTAVKYLTREFKKILPKMKEMDLHIDDADVCTRISARIQ